MCNQIDLLSNPDRPIWVLSCFHLHLIPPKGLVHGVFDCNNWSSFFFKLIVSPCFDSYEHCDLRGVTWIKIMINSHSHIFNSLPWFLFAWDAPNCLGCCAINSHKKVETQRKNRTRLLYCWYICDFNYLNLVIPFFSQKTKEFSSKIS